MMTEANPEALSNEERGRQELNRAFWQTMWSTVALHIVYELSTYVLTLFFALKSEELTGLVLAGQWTAFRADIPWLIVLIGGVIAAEPLLRLWRNRVLLRESLAYERRILARYLRQDTARAKELPAANMTDRLQIDLVSYRFSRFTLCAHPLAMLLCLVAGVLLMQRQIIFASGVLLLMTASWVRGGRLKSRSALAEARLLELEHRKNDRLMDTAEHHDFYYVNKLQTLPRQSLEGTLAELQEASCVKDLRTLGHSEEFSENSSLLLYIVAIALGLTLCRQGHMEVSQLVGSLFLLTPLTRLHDLWTEFQEARFTLRECEKRIIAVVTGAPEPMHFDQHEAERWYLSLSPKDRAEDVPPEAIETSTIQALRLRQLACTYDDRPIFTDLNLQLERGDLCLITGANGSGKTSLLKILAGLQKPAAGSLAWLLPDGSEVRIPVGSASIQYLPQHPHFFSGTAWQNTWLLAESWTESQDFARERAQAQAFLGRFHFAASAEQPIDAQGLPLSGGEQQKLQFSRRLRRPGTQVLILDEPSKFLDQDSLPALRELILQGREERITVLITHDARLLDLPFSKKVNLEEYRTSEAPASAALSQF